jgi:C-terminal processing protease CtpA/Prc
MISLRLLLCATLLSTTFHVAGEAQGRPFNARDRARARTMLSVVARDVREQFWDSTLKGVPFDSLLAVSDSLIRTADNYGQVNGIIARFVMSLGDSHTWYLPPWGVNKIQLGWEPYAIGDSVYLRGISPWAADSAIGLRTGDRLVAVDGWRVERRRIHDLIYLRRFIQPRPALDLVVEGADGAQRAVSVPIQAVPGRQYYDLSRLGGGSDWWQLIREGQAGDSTWDSRFASPSDGVLYWRLRSFTVSDRHIREGLERARGKPGLILDLRGNGGGYVSTLAYLLARLARPEHAGDTLYAEIRRRRIEPMVVDEVAARQRWNGRLIVLVDSESASASEALADAVQQLQLGRVLGDRTAGALTMARSWGHITNEATTVLYGANIAIAMLQRPDGSRIEGVGVLPDEIAAPTPDDLRAGRDPVLARALQMFDLPYDPVRAGRYFRYGDATTLDR